MSNLYTAGRFQGLDAAGNPLSGGLLWTYVAGTLTPQATYTTADLDVPNTNPVVLDSSGRAPVWLGDGIYRMILRTADGVTVTDDDDISGDPSGGSGDDALAALALSSGSSLVGFLQAGTGTTARTVQAKAREQVSILDFGADPTGATSSQDALDACRAFCAAATTPPEIVWPAGIYTYATSPNWGITNLKMTALGMVRLRCTGTGNAFIIDAGPNAADLRWNVQIGRFHIDGLSTGGHGVYVRSIHHSRLSFNVRSCGTGKAGIKVEFAVVTVFDDPTVSNNEDWYLGHAATYGIWLGSRLPGETASYCTFNNPVIEGCTSHGIWLEGTLGNAFISGTSEGNYGWGVYATAGSNNDKFYGTDFEVNTLGDLFVEGTAVQFLDCDCTGYAYLNGSYDRLHGGLFNQVELGTDARGCSADSITYYRFLGPPQPSPTFVTTDNALTGERILKVNSRGLLRGMAVVGANIPLGTVIEGVEGESGCTPDSVRLSNTITGNIGTGASINFGYQTTKNTNAISAIGTSRLYFADTSDLLVGMKLPLVNPGIVANTYITAVSGSYIDITNPLTLEIASATRFTLGDGVVGSFRDGGTYTHLDNVRNYNTTFNFLTARENNVTPGSIGSLANYTYTVTVDGAKVGDIARASISYVTSALMVVASVTAANTVTVTLFNVSGSAVDPGTISYTNVVLTRPAIL